MLGKRRQADMDVRETKAGDEVVPKAPKAPARFSPAVGRAYGRFLELPAALVLAVLWVAGAMLLGSGALVVYLAGWMLVRSVAGVP